MSRRDLMRRCGIEPPPPEGLDTGAGVALDPCEPPAMDEHSHGALLALYSDMVASREATGCPRLADHCDALGAILRRHEPNGIG